MNALATYLKNVRAELSHVVWPPRKQALTHVALIVLITAFTAVLIAVLDYIFTRGVGFFLGA